MRRKNNAEKTAGHKIKRSKRREVQVTLAPLRCAGANKIATLCVSKCSLKGWFLRWISLPPDRKSHKCNPIAWILAYICTRESDTQHIPVDLHPCGSVFALQWSGYLRWWFEGTGKIHRCQPWAFIQRNRLMLSFLHLQLLQLSSLRAEA